MKKRILSGMRPTGRLHLGHLVGALDNWSRLQEEYETFYMVADWHAISTAYEDKIALRELSVMIIADWIAAGIDPEKSVLFIQSAVKEHAELHLLLSMLTPLSWVERNPSFKETIEQLTSKNISTYGFLGYPVLQAADILMYMAEVVPVGQDQLPHLELAREIVRKFNNLYSETLLEPKAMLTKAPKLLGLDKRKMSKSYNNFILMSEEETELKKKVNAMITDPARVYKTDPGHPDICAVFEYHGYFSSGRKDEICDDCKNAKIGCVACKKILFDNLNSIITPIREKSASLLTDKNKLFEIIQAGNARARKAAEKTMEKVRKNMGLDYSTDE